MLFKFIPATLAILSFLSSVSAWGPLGHSAVAYLAMYYLDTPAVKSVQSILSADPYKTYTNPTLDSVANWAHDYSHTPGGTWSWALHYADANDDPDCNGAGGCIITAIQNYTARVQDHSLKPEERAEALKFLVGLFGDVTQPLNAEAFQLHGFDTPVLWNGVQSNLHDVWDTEMITKLAGGDSFPVETWTGKILEEIIKGQLPPDWTSCTGIQQAQICATDWASDAANALISSYVLDPFPAGKELNGTYYDGAVPIIQLQIAKAGYRLAVWLNKIFARSPES